MKTKIGIIGGGNMGAAIISGIQEKYSVSVCEQDKKRCQVLKRTYRVSIVSLAKLLKNSKIVILAVKPQSFEGVLSEVKGNLNKRSIVVSIAAGITTRYIEKQLGQGVRVIRTMPNLPAQIGLGTTGICAGKNATTGNLREVASLFDNIGITAIVREKDLDAITAVSGSGPAYVFLFAECLYDAARSLGLNSNVSRTLVYATMAGSVELMLESQENAEVLRKRVTSKGGTTEAALKVFKSKNIDKIFNQALKEASKRSKQLSR